MDYRSVYSVFLIFACILEFSAGQYAVPEITFEAFTPQGLKISIHAEKGVELFVFHGKDNKQIFHIKLGEFSEDVTQPINGNFFYFNPSIKLQEGDVINYWVFVPNQLDFPKKEWTVDKLLPSADIEKPSVSSSTSCGRTVTKVLGKTNICSGDDIINYKFTETNPNPQLWLVEEFIPHDPDYEFVIYKHEPDVIGVENNVLRIRPKVVEENAMKDIFLTECTRKVHSPECGITFNGIFQNPGIVSGRIVSRNAFCFANITIKAKLPQGDWIFPEIYLEDINDAKRKLLIAYARGNKKLTGDNGVDIGGKMLFGGPYMNPTEPSRSSYLAKHLSQNHIGADWHVFSIRWTKEQIMLYIDDVHYGTINADALRATGFDQEIMVRLVLGLGVAGINDFPDNHISGSDIKPWINRQISSPKKFLRSRNVWEKTWNDDSRLLVEYVTIKAL